MAGAGAAAGAGAGAAGAAGAGAGAGADVAAAGAAAAAVTGAACWGSWTCTGEPLGSAMMLREESEGTRRPADDLPLETSLASSPTPLDRRTPSPSAAAAAAAGACHEGREPEAEPGGGRRLRRGGGDGRRRRPPRPPRAPILARAVLSALGGTAAPSRPACRQGSFHALGAWRLQGCFRGSPGSLPTQPRLRPRQSHSPEEAPLGLRGRGR